jgi:hypothetical protein
VAVSAHHSFSKEITMFRDLIFGDFTLSQVMAEGGLPESLLTDPVNRCTFERWNGASHDYATLAYVDARKLREDWVKNTESYAHIKRKARPIHPTSYREDEYTQKGTWHCEIPVFGYDRENLQLPDFVFGETKCQCDFWWYHDKAPLIPVLVARESGGRPSRQRFLNAYAQQPKFVAANAQFIEKYEQQLMEWLERFPRDTILGEYTKMEDGHWQAMNGVRYHNLLRTPNSPHCPIIVAAWGADQKEKEYMRATEERRARWA